MDEERSELCLDDVNDLISFSGGNFIDDQVMEYACQKSIMDHCFLIGDFPEEYETPSLIRQSSSPEEES